MKRRVCLTLCGAALALALAACGGENPTAGAESQPSLVSSQAESSQQESSQQESSQQAATPQPRQAEPSQGESASSAAEGALVLTQQDSGAEAGYEPTITLYPDGTFALFASFYDGSVTISGTYAQEGDGYVLTPTDSTAQGTAGSDVGEITLTPSGGGFAYSGGQLGATYDGAVFLPPQQ